MWDSSLGLVCLDEALSMWLGVLVVVLLAVLMMLVMVLLVSLNNQLESIRWQLN